MKRLYTLLILTLLIGLKVQGQQTYWTPGVPPGSTSFSPTYRFIGTDSLLKLFIANGNRTSQVYTATQVNSLLGTVLPSQTGNSGKYLTTNGTIASWATITGGVSSVGSGYGLLGGPIISTGTLVVDTNKIGLASDMILSGMVTTASGTTATTTAGSYRLNGTVYTISSTNTTIPAADATLSRFSVIYGNTSGALAVTNGTLSANPDVPTIPANTLLVSTILITPTGTTTTGGNGKISANNGLTLKNGTIQLGGSLLHTTTINFSSSSPFSFVDSGNGSTMSVNSSGFNTNWVNGGNTTQFISGQIQNLMTISNGSNQTGFNTDYVLGNRILDGIFNRGITFAANYTTNQRLQRLSVPSVNTVIALADSVKGTISVGATIYTGDSTLFANRVVRDTAYKLTFGDDALNKGSVIIDNTGTGDVEISQGSSQYGLLSMVSGEATLSGNGTYSRHIKLSGAFGVSGIEMYDSSNSGVFGTVLFNNRGSTYFAQYGGFKTINSSAISGSGNILLQTPITLTTTGTSGAATFSGGTLNIPQYSGATQVGSEPVSGTINGSNTSFTVAHTPISGSFSLFLNGLMLIPTTDYTRSGTTITMTTAPVSGDNLMANYSY